MRDQENSIRVDIAGHMFPKRWPSNISRLHRISQCYHNVTTTKQEIDAHQLAFLHLLPRNRKLCYSLTRHSPESRIGVNEDIDHRRDIAYIIEAVQHF